MASSGHSSRPVARLAIALLVLVLVLGYTAAVVGGEVAGDRKIDAVHLGLLAVAALLVLLLVRPEALDRLKLFELGGMRLEMLEQVKEQQDRQEKELEDIRLMLPLLLPENERNHILNLAQGATKGYDGSGNLRAELRRLRYVGLIHMKPGRAVGELKTGAKHDLAEVVSLTGLGERWVKRIREIEAADGAGP